MIAPLTVRSRYSLYKNTIKIFYSLINSFEIKKLNLKNPIQNFRRVLFLPVHVVGSGSGIITEPDSEVLDLQRVLLPDLLDGDDLSSGLLELTELTEEIPKPNSFMSNNIYKFWQQRYSLTPPPP